MNDATQKIAAEAAERIADLCESHPSLTREIKREVQSAIEKATEEINAANCSLLALAAIVKGHPDTPESLKAIASKELLDHTRGAYLINELRTLRAAHASDPWTADYVHRLFRQHWQSSEAFQLIADTHNETIYQPTISERMKRLWQRRKQDVQQSPENEPPFMDTPLLAAKRKAFDNPTQENLDALIRAAHASDEQRREGDRITRQNLTRLFGNASEE